MRPEVALAALAGGTRFVVLDVETTPSDNGTRVVSLGVASWTTETRQVRPWYGEYNPECHIETTHVHGIDDAQVANAPKFGDDKQTGAQRLIDSLSPRRTTRVVLVAHNAMTDIPALLGEYERTDLTMPDVEVLDTLPLARHLDVPGSRALPRLLETFGLSVTNHHHARDDAYDAARLLARLLTKAAASTTDLSELLAAVQSERLRRQRLPDPAAQS